MSKSRNRRSGASLLPRLPGWPQCLRGSLLFLLLLTSAGARAEMQLDRSILVFDADSPPRQDVEVRNTGGEILYLDTEILVVEAPGTDAETRRPVLDPDAAGVLITPARAVLPPGGRQLLRIVLLDDPPEVDRIYRINVRPVVPPLEADQTAVKVVVAYQLLVIQRPLDPSPGLTWTREGHTITFRNDGNTNVLLFNGRQCDGASESSCRELPDARRIYAGTSWRLDLPFDAPVEFTAATGESNVRRRFD